MNDEPTDDQDDTLNVDIGSSQLVVYIATLANSVAQVARAVLLLSRDETEEAKKALIKTTDLLDTISGDLRRRITKALDDHERN